MSGYADKPRKEVAKCKYCGAEIRFLRNIKSGKWMVVSARLLNPARVEENTLVCWECEPGKCQVLRYRADGPAAGGRLYEAHQASCSGYPKAGAAGGQA